MKSLLIAKSNLRKFKGLSICLTLLILICSMFITAIGLLETDYKGSIRRNSNALNTSDVAYMNVDSQFFTEEEIVQYLPDGVKEYVYTEVIYTNVSCKYASGSNMFTVYIEKESCFERKISQVEIVKQKKSITENYIYLPYQFNTGGKIDIGDNYKIKIGDFENTYKVKGFINSTYGGCMNMGQVEFVVPDNVYNEILAARPDEITEIIYINFENTNNLDARLSKHISDIKLNYGLTFSYGSEEDIVLNRGFMADIFFVIFLVVVIIVVIITLLSIFNNINNYLKENIKTLGVLKAIGYKSNDIRLAIVVQFSILIAIGLISGIILGYAFIPCIAGILSQQSGLPYTVSFNFISTLLPIIIIPLFVYLIIILAVLKVKRINAVDAMRDSSGSHVFKYNPVALDKTKVNINLSIALKNFFNTIKHNVVNLFVIIFVSLLMITAVTFYENFDRNPNVSLMTNDYSEVMGAAKKEYADEFYEILSNDSRVTNLRMVYSLSVQDENYINIYFTAESNMDNYKNKDYVYKGRLPKYDNEVAISGSYAKKEGYSIGETIKLKAYNEYDYIIVGFVQSTNNGGREGLMSFEALDRIAPNRETARTYYFDVNGNTSRFVKEYKNNYENMIEDLLTFDELLDSALDTFKALSKSLLLIILVVSGADIALVMYLILRSLIYKRRFEYGILKALGFTSKQLIIQNIISFMPTIILGTILGMVIGYFTTNPMFTLGMSSFGIMRCNMSIPIDLVFLSGVFLILISLLSIYLMSKRIKKIEPYKLLIEE